MKNNIFILMALFVSMSFFAYSQPLSKNQLPEILSSEQEKLKSVVYQDFSKMGVIESRRTHYEYVYSDTLITRLATVLKSNIWVNNEKYEEYYSDGNMYKYIYYEWAEEEWQQTREVRYEYNEYGKVIDLRVYDPPSRLTHHYIYELKENGDTLKIFGDSFGDDSTEIRVFNNKEYFYNTQGKLVRIFTENGYQDSVYSNNETIYEYDEFGNMVSSTYYNDEYLRDKDEYTYNESNLLIRSSWLRMNNEDILEELVRYEYEYDDLDNIFIDRRYSLNREKSELILEYMTFYSYNDDNELIESVRKRNRNEGLINYEKYNYDIESDLFVEHRYEWENKWVETYRCETTYNKDGDKEFIKLFYPVAVGLENNTKKKYQYNLDNLISYVETYSWNGASWDKSENNNISYNDDQKVQIRINENIDDKGNVSKDKYEYTYNDKGDTLEIIISEDFEDPGVRKFHYYFDYDYDKKVIAKTYAYWANYFWYNKDRLVQFFNHFGQKDSVLKQIYFTGEWMNELKYIYEYDNEQRLLTNSHYQYSLTDEEWKLHFKYFYSYNNKDYLDSLTVFDYSKENHDVSKYHIDYKFDEYGNTSEELWILIHEDPEKTRDYQKYIYEYFEPTDVTENITDQSLLSVSPNPATDNFNISINRLAGENATIRIYDIYGNCVFSRELSMGLSSKLLTISADDLSSGVYTIFYVSEDKTESIKVIVVR